jgi:creatinine amidohydrolase
VKEKKKKFNITGLREGWVWTERKWNKITEDTGVGNPKKATVEKSKKFLEDLTNNISQFLVEFAECDVNDIYG